MIGRKILASLCALAALSLPAHLSAQETAPQAAEQEVEAIQQQLQAIQQRALQDPALQARQAEIGQEVVATMSRVDPAFDPAAARAQTMQADIAAAQEAGDNARLHELAAESEQLQATFAAARARAMEDPELQASIQAFQAEVVEKMTEMDPETTRLLARLNELNEQ